MKKQTSYNVILCLVLLSLVWSNTAPFISLIYDGEVMHCEIIDFEEKDAEDKEEKEEKKEKQENRYNHPISSILSYELSHPSKQGHTYFSTLGHLAEVPTPPPESYFTSNS